MRPFGLWGIAAEAEMLRLNQRARRTALDIGLGCVAVVLLFAALAFGHVGAWDWLRETQPAKYVALILAGADFIIAAIFLAIVLRSKPGKVELEALAIRRRAMDDAKGALSVTTLAVSLMELFMASRRRR
jgi:hypothetical protein